MISGFSVIRRNYGQWDICSDRKRLFRLRGGPGEWHIYDERAETRPYERPVNSVPFRDQAAAMSWVCAELMHELLIAAGQNFHVIESWNVAQPIPKLEGGA